MKYIIKRSVANQEKIWVRSSSYPKEYSLIEAQDIVKGERWLKYKISEVSEPFYSKGIAVLLPLAPLPPRPYRRHEAVSPLELRGALAMLESAREYTCKQSLEYPTLGSSTDSYCTWEVLFAAYVNVKRQLEKR